MFGKSYFERWPQAIVEEVGAVVSHWQAVKQGAMHAFWPTAPRGVTRYIDEMLAAQTLTVTRKSG
jgi:hypothetical protein